MENDIRTAIENLSEIEFFAKGHLRIGQPHLLGIAQNGKRQVEVYQTGGSSSRGIDSIPNWRRFDIKDIKSLSLGDEHFIPRHDFNPQSPYWARVETSVR